MKKSILFLLVLFVTTSLNAQKTNKKDSNSVKKQTTEKDIILDATEEMPEYPGGDQALMTFIGNNVQYPTDAKEQGIQGTVVLRFVVTAIGTVGKIDIIRGVSPSLDAEAVRVVNMLKGWKNNANRDVYFTLPIRFRFTDETPHNTPSYLVKEKQMILLDGYRLAVGFDLSKIKASDYDIEVRKPETDAIKASLIEKYGPDAEFGVIFLTSKAKKENALAKDTIHPTSQRIVSFEPDVMPTYPGGEAALINFINHSIRYPEDAREANIKGTCVVKFVVNQSGNVESPEIVKKVCPSIDKESIRVVSLLKGWNPATQKGKPIDAYFTLPIRFKLAPTNEDTPNWNR